MAQGVIVILSVLASQWLFVSPAQAERRLALVIGIDDYVELPPLRMAVSDAKAVATALTSAGFSVTTLTNSDRRDLKRGISNFQQALTSGDMALVFFSGQGIEIDGRNYLLPADVIKPAWGDRESIRDDAIALDWVLTRLVASGAATRILIIDACHDNSVAASGASGICGERGLARVDVPTGTFILFSAGYGQKALHRLSATDTEPNSVFVRVLLRHIGTPSLDVAVISRAIRRDVATLAKSVGHDQRPAFRDELDDVALLSIGTGVTVAQSQPGPASATAETCKEDAVVVFDGNQARCLKPGDEFRDCDGCPEMVVIPAGRFTMGSPDSESMRESDEGPQHEVIISKPFAVGKFEVTYAEWDSCLRDGGCDGYRPDDEGWGRGLRPVAYVGWNDAQNYVTWLSRKTGVKYRLLSESEREYVTRAGTTTPFSTGETITADQANFNGNSTYNGSSPGKHLNRTIEVGSFQANGFGLNDTHGNVVEWTEDCYYDSYVGAPTDGTAREGKNDCLRVARDGSHSNDPTWLRSAFRIGGRANFRNGSVGFRVARSF